VIRDRTGAVAVYDPNGTNPYGNELAGVLALLGHKVRHSVPAVRAYQAEAGVTVVPELGGPVGTSSSRIGSVLRRLVGPLRAVLLQPPSSPVVAAWTVDPWDMALLGLRAALGGQVFVVLHNPRQVDGRAGRWANLERALLRRCVICVHSDRLQAMALQDFPRVEVTPHPPFLTAVRGQAHWDAEALNRRRGLPRVSFIGDPRPDKGVNDLPAIAQAVGEPFELAILGAGRLPVAVADALREAKVSLFQSADVGPLSDRALVAGLLDSVCVIAPYRSVTESGSIRLATAVGVPVLAFETDGVKELLPATQMASDAPALGRLVAQRVRNPGTAHEQLSLREQLKRSSEAWKELLCATE
jgi:glycosyltransferase involved in cell wall biosynthesis